MAGAAQQNSVEGATLRREKSKDKRAQDRRLHLASLREIVLSFLESIARLTSEVDARHHDDATAEILSELLPGLGRLAALQRKHLEDLDILVQSTFEEDEREEEQICNSSAHAEVWATHRQTTARFLEVEKRIKHVAEQLGKIQSFLALRTGQCPGMLGNPSPLPPRVPISKCLGNGGDATAPLPDDEVDDVGQGLGNAESPVALAGWASENGAFDKQDAESNAGSEKSHLSSPRNCSPADGHAKVSSAKKRQSVVKIAPRGSRTNVAADPGAKDPPNSMMFRRRRSVVK